MYACVPKTSTVIFNRFLTGAELRTVISNIFYSACQSLTEQPLTVRSSYSNSQRSDFNSFTGQWACIFNDVSVKRPVTGSTNDALGKFYLDFAYNYKIDDNPAKHRLDVINTIR